MTDRRPNHYEKAFGNWLMDNAVPFVAIDDRKRLAISRANIKHFDYLVYPPSQKAITAEVKGRLFKGTSLSKLSGFECWVGADDITGLQNWQEIFGDDHRAAFIFTYALEKPDVELAGRIVYEYCGQLYLFFCIMLDDYCKNMKLRSPQWRTVTLPADKFRACAIQMQNVVSS